MEGLAYLTFDADVKEDLVQDKHTLLAMFELAKVVLIPSFSAYKWKEAFLDIEGAIEVAEHDVLLTPH